MYVSKFQIYIYKRKIKLYQHNFHNYYIMDQSWRDNFGIYTSCLQAAWPSDNPKKVRGYNRIPSTEQIQPCPGNLIPIHHSQLQYFILHNGPAILYFGKCFFVLFFFLHFYHISYIISFLDNDIGKTHSNMFFSSFELEKCEDGIIFVYK